MRVTAGIAVVALGLLAAGCGGTQGVGTGASGMVPADTPIYVAIDTDPGSSQWKTVNALASRFPDKQKAVDSIKKGLRDSADVDWEKDVKPALGKELDFAWLDLDHGAQDFVLLTQPRDEGKFKALIAKANEQDPSSRVVYEKVNGWYVLAETHAMIDRYKRATAAATTTLADEPSFNHAMDTLGTDSIVRAYVSGAKIMDLIQASSPADAKKFINQAGTLDWFALRLGAKADGIAWDTIVHGTPGKLFKGVPHGKPFNSKLTHEVPQDALAYLTFHGAKNMLGSLQKNPVLATPELKRFSGVLGQVGTLLQGENALYVRAPATGRIPEVSFVAAPGAGVDGAAILDRLVRRFRTDIGATPKRTSIEGTASRTLRFGEFAVHYANVDGKLVITDLPQGFRGVENPGTPLSQGATFKDARQASGMPGRTQGFLYVNIHSTIPAVERLSHANLPAEVSRNLKPLRSAVEYAVSRSHEIEVSFFLRIK
jgi:Protein of unknown function (DUF3352)